MLTSKQHTLMLASMRAARVPWGDFTAQMERIRKDCGAVDPRHYSILFSALKDNSGIAHERAKGVERGSRRTSFRWQVAPTGSVRDARAVVGYQGNQAQARITQTHRGGERRYGATS